MAKAARWSCDGLWLLLTLGLWALVANCGVNFPYMDEWPMVDALANRRPVLAWAFEWHNEHLLPLPRLLFWLLYQIGDDLRLGMLVSVAMWSALARLLMAAARSARGGPAFADALFPLLLLHPGQYENALMSYQVGFALSALLAGVAFAAVSGGATGVRRVAIAGVCAAALPLCGGHGLLFALPVLAWLVAVGLAGALRRGGVSRTAGAVGAAACLAGVATASLYLWLPGKPPPLPGVPPLTFLRWVAGVLGFGAGGYGSVGERLWGASAAVPAAVWAAAAYSVWRNRREIAGPRWASYFGAGAAIAGTALLAAAISWGRARHGMHAVFFPRYCGLSVLVSASAVLFWLRFGPRWLATHGPSALAILALAALPYNVWAGWRSAGRLAEIQRGARADLEAGVPVEVIGRKYHWLIFNDPPGVAYFLARYVEYGMSPVKTCRHEPEGRTVPLPELSTVGAVRPLDGGGWAGTGSDAALVFAVDPPRFVHSVAIRGHYQHRAVWPPARATVAIRRVPGGDEEIQTVPIFRYSTPNVGEPTIVVWVDGPVAGVRLVPDEAPWGFRVTSAELRVP